MLVAVTPAPTLSYNTWNCTYNAASCSCCCHIMTCNSKSYQLIVYGSSDVVGVENDSEDDGGSRVGGDNCCLESTDSVSDSLPDSYSKLDIFLYRG